MTWSHLLTKRCWKNHDVCLQVYVLIALTLRVLQLQNCVPKESWWNTHTRNNQWILSIARRLPTILLGDIPKAPATGSSLPKEQGSHSHLLTFDTVEVVLKLEDVPLSESTSTTYDPHKSLQQHDLSGRKLLQDQQHIPSLSEAQLRQAMRAVPMDCLGLNCWTCHDLDHSKFSCQYLDWKKIIYYGYRYY